MKKTLLAIAIPTLALTGCFGSGSDNKGHYTPPTPQVKPSTEATKPSTKPSTEATKPTKPSTEATKPSTDVKPGNTHTKPGNTHTKPGNTHVIPGNNTGGTGGTGGTGTGGTGTGGTGTGTGTGTQLPVPTDVLAAQAQAKQAYEAAVAALPQQTYNKLLKDQITFSTIATQASSYVSTKSTLESREASLYTATANLAEKKTDIAVKEAKIEKLKKDLVAVAGNDTLVAQVENKISTAEKELKNLKDALPALERAEKQAEVNKALAAKNVASAKEAIEIVSKQYSDNADAQKFLAVANAGLDKLDATEAVATKTRAAADRAFEVISKSVEALKEEYKEAKGDYAESDVEDYENLMQDLKGKKDAGKLEEAAKIEARVNTYVAEKSLQPLHEMKSKLNELEKSKEALSKKKSAVNNLYGTVTGALTGHNSTNQNLSSVSQNNLKTALYNPKNRISVSLNNAVHGFIGIDYFYQGYATPTKYLEKMKDTSVAYQAVYAGDAFVREGAKEIVKGSSEFNVNFGTKSSLGSISGAISYGDNKKLIMDNAEISDGNFASGAFEGAFYGEKAEELAGYYMDDTNLETITATFGASKK